MSNIFFTSDTHFDHINIIKHCHRPFNSIEEMNETIISNWNKVVNPNDIVYHLGDFAFVMKNDTRYIDILKRLNGSIYLVLGNHDNRIDKSLFRNYSKFNMEIINGLYIFMRHKYNPILRENLSKDVLYLHGHEHGTLQLNKPNIYDVGVDNNNYYPISLEEIVSKLRGKK